MKFKKVLSFVVVILSCIYGCNSLNKSYVFPTALKCEYLENPVGIDTEMPRFLWILNSNEKSKMQTAYRIVVYTRNSASEETIWDSGKILCPGSVNNFYKGEKALQSQTTYYWKVKIWDENDMESSWSDPAFFHTGFLGNDTIKGKWIMNNDTLNRSPLLRKSFNLNKKIQSAHVYLTSIGLYELYLNGSKVDNQLFQPAVTQFSERVLYSTYDVTRQLKKGENVLGIWLGEGQASLTRTLKDRFTNINMQEKIFPRPMVLLQLHIKYPDKTESNIISDETWTSSSSPIVYNNFYGGEDYDARLENESWCMPNYDNSNWERVETGNYQGSISAQVLQPVKEGNIYMPVRTIKRDDGNIYEYDFGKTIGGYWEIEVSGPAGSSVTMRGSEKCGGSIYQKPLSRESKLYWDEEHTGQYFYRDCYSKYILKGDGVEKYKPRFFYHGFRYVQVKLSSPDSVKIESLKVIESNNDISNSGTFESSDSLLNAIHDITSQTFKNNFIQGVPLSNPNAEKYGWTGDVHLFIEACDYSFNTPALWTKWLTDFKDAQHWCNNQGMIPLTVPELRKRKPATDVSWLYVYPFLVLHMYSNYNDEAILKNHYNSLYDWYQYIKKSSHNFIIGGQVGDHMIPGINYESLHNTRPILKLINTAYFYKTTMIMSKIALSLQKKEDYQMFINDAKKIKNRFNEEFYDPGSNTYSENPAPEGFSFHIPANAIPLQMGLVPDNKEKSVLKNIINYLDSVDYRCFAGILGTKALIDILDKHNRLDILYKVIKNPEYPGWIHMLNLGASTLNQTWEGSGDYNHCMFGSVNQFFYRNLAGIHFPHDHKKRIIEFIPYVPSNMNFVNCKVESIYGVIESNWKKIDGGIQFSLHIPPNTSGIFKYLIPSNEFQFYLNGECIVENNEILHTPSEIVNINIKNQEKIVQLGSGRYTLKVL
jgi:alpha-L-rhamnosidase